MKSYMYKARAYVQNAGIIARLRTLRAGSDAELERIYWSDWGGIPGSVIAALYPRIKWDPGLSDRQITELALADAGRMALLAKNLKWEETSSAGAAGCNHAYNKERFKECPYCNPPAYADIAQSPIASFDFSASRIAGDFAYVQYEKKRLTLACGGRLTAPKNRSVLLDGGQVSTLREYILACHIEEWNSFDSSRMLPVGRSLPKIEIMFENGKAICWCNEITCSAEWLVVEAILSDLLGERFSLSQR